MRERFLSWVDRNTEYPGDSDETLFIKRIWWICLTFAVPVIALLAVVVYFMGLPGVALLVLISDLYWLGSMLVFRSVKRGIEWFGLSSQLFLIIQALAMAWLMGGILDSGGVVFFGLIGPVYALVFPQRRRALVIFVIYLVGLVVLGILDSRIEAVFPLTYSQNLALFIMTFIICAGFWFVALYFFATQRTTAIEDLRREEEKSQSLLLNILPAKIAGILRESPPDIIADQLDNVSILFADLVNFTPAVADMDPEEVIRFLNRTFTYFDRLTEKYGLEKIKTIGDCYMAVAGAPDPQKDHALAAVQMAIDIQSYAKREGLQFRVGINSGPVVAGVIGVKKFSYDMWGDTVNKASRLESNAGAGGILISESTYKMVRDRVSCTEAGVRDLKGIGNVRTWYIDLRGQPDSILRA